MADKKIKLLHLHLPKTGGTALRRFFVDQLGEESVSPPLQGMMLEEALLQWRDTAVISGHFIARQADIIPPERLAVTVLRDPVDRFLSEYFYNKFDVDNLLVDACQRAGDLETYIEHLSQVPANAPMTQMEMLYPLGTTAQTRLSTDEKFSASKIAIDQFALVGVQEEMEDFCSMLCAKFRWPLAWAEQLNVTSRRLQPSDLTTGQRRAIENLLEPEIALYSYAHSRFKRDRRGFISSAGLAAEGHPDLSSAANEDSNETEHCPEPVKQDFGDLRCQINAVEIIGRVSGPGQVMTGEMMDVLFHVTAREALDQVSAGIAIKDEHGSLAFGTNSLLLGDIYSLAPGSYTIRFSTLNRLGPGAYSVDAALTPTSSHYDGCFHWRHAAASFNALAYATQHFEGKVLLDIDLGIESTSEGAAWCRKLPNEETISARAFSATGKALTTFRSSLDVMSSVDLAPLGTDLLLQVKLTNQSTETWHSRGRYPVKLSYRWLTETGRVVVADGARTDLPGDLAPGAYALTCMHVRLPDVPGRYCLAASLVQEHIAWFIDQDHTNGRILPITVLSANVLTALGET
ncbi:Wzt carbohydrate-binding domain-containing protein [Dyella silvae]|uniref:Wzt carbohydrate-binding domain-containing protein n=1 Tax=Dyella silvae TaxID=2994424 RepID=UPI0022653813|nr:Wzt carbohydrate-binding domain-containing protein [Dyella silvae]